MRITLLALVLLAAACGGPPCSGCIDAAGACVAGTAADACGKGGGKCVACAGADRCGAATGSCAPCGKANCSGCCFGDGRCNVEVRDRDTACGFDGAACVDCTASGKTCNTTTLGCG